jgi:hypothetical protein
MNPKFTLVSEAELLATEIGISGAPLPPNGPGRKNPMLKYIIIGGVVFMAIVIAYQLHKKSTPKLKIEKDE